MATVAAGDKVLEAFGDMGRAKTEIENRLTGIEELTNTWHQGVATNLHQEVENAKRDVETTKMEVMHSLNEVESTARNWDLELGEHLRKEIEGGKETLNLQLHELKERLRKTQNDARHAFKITDKAWRESVTNEQKDRHQMGTELYAKVQHVEDKLKQLSEKIGEEDVEMCDSKAVSYTHLTLPTKA